MEGTPEAQGQSNQASGPRDGPNHSGHQLDVLGHQAQKAPNLPVEKYSPLMAERETRPSQN